MNQLKNMSKKELFWNIIDWLAKMIGYATILVLASLIFQNTLYIDSNYYGLWAFIAAIIIYLLNKTLKPILIWLTIPITGITLGLFYPFINLIILKLVSLILYPHFIIKGFLFALLASILISILNITIEEFIFKKMERSEEN